VRQAFDFNNAHAAGSGERKAAEITKCRDLYPDPVDDRQDRFSFLGRYLPPVDLNIEKHDLSI
jgi:hypothetical protein